MDAGGGGADGLDRISALPDELLAVVITHLRCSQAAARTSVLARRWRRIWTHVREIYLSDRSRPRVPIAAPSILGVVDAALDAYAAPELDRLDIEVVNEWHVTVARLAQWLRFSSERLAGEVRPSIGDDELQDWSMGHRDLELQLPVCEKATAIHIRFLELDLQPSIPATGKFEALRELSIACFDFTKLDMERIVSLQCPRLQKLALVGLGKSKGVQDLSIRSGSLEWLKLRIRICGKLTVVAPKLVRFETFRSFDDYRIYNGSSSRKTTLIVAPKLVEVIWRSCYDQRFDHIMQAGRHLRVLEVNLFDDYPQYAGPVSDLLQRFDTVDELTLRVKIPKEPIHYQKFVQDTMKLPGCKTLRIILLSQHHEFASIVLHLLRICDGIRRLDIQLLGFEHKISVSDCACGLSENKSSEGIIMNSLEEVNINYFREYKDEVDLLRTLLRWKFIPRRVSIHASPLVGSLSVETCKKIASSSHCDTRVEFHGWLNGSYVYK